jgi:hypothetical protein
MGDKFTGYKRGPEGQQEVIKRASTSEEGFENLKRSSSVEEEKKEKDRCLTITALHALSPVDENDAYNLDYPYEDMRLNCRLLSMTPVTCSNFFSNSSFLQGSRNVQLINKSSSAEKIVSSMAPEYLRESGKLGQIAINITNADQANWPSDLNDEYEEEIIKQIPGGKDTRDLKFERMIFPQVLTAEPTNMDVIRGNYNTLLTAARTKLLKLGKEVDDKRNYLTGDELSFLEENGFYGTLVGTTRMAGHMMNNIDRDKLGYIILSQLIIKVKDRPTIIINSIQNKELNIIEVLHLKTIYSRLNWTEKDNAFFADKKNENIITQNITNFIYDFFLIQEKWNKYCDDNKDKYSDFYVSIERGVVITSNTFFNRLIILLIKQFIIITGINKEENYTSQLDRYSDIVQYSQDMEREYGETVIYDVSNACRNITGKFDSSTNRSKKLTPAQKKVILDTNNEQHQIFMDRSASYNYCRSSDKTDCTKEPSVDAAAAASVSSISMSSEGGRLKRRTKKNNKKLRRNTRKMYNKSRKRRTRRSKR